MKNYLWNMFSIIKNGQLALRPFVVFPNNKNCLAFLNILWDEGFILGFKITQAEPNQIKIFLSYKNETPTIQKIKPISRPGHRVYFSNTQLWKIKSNIGLVIISTSKGFLTASVCKKMKIGGELLILIT